MISAWISEPVASVPMNESIRITTTTTALIRPIADADERAPIASAGTSGMPSVDEVRDDDAGQRHHERERQVEHARGERDQ